jgi:hypothetical protein
VVKPKLFSNLYGSNLISPGLTVLVNKESSNDFCNFLLTNLLNCFSPTNTFKSLRSCGLAFLFNKASPN